MKKQALAFLIIILFWGCTKKALEIDTPVKAKITTRIEKTDCPEGRVVTIQPAK